METVVASSSSALSASPEAFEALSWEAWWRNDVEALFEARELAYRAYRAAGDDLGAARMACWLGTDSVDFRGQTAVASGWLARARRLLEGREETLEYGLLLIHEAEKLMYVGDTDTAIAHGSEALALARRLGHFDLESLATSTIGLAQVFAGYVDEGSRRLEEAASAALADELDQTWAAGWCCCYLIYGCEQVRDYERAVQWCRSIEEWATRRLGALQHTCRARYASVLVWQGAWDAAEAELTEAMRALVELRPPAVSDAGARLGELRRRQARAEEALRLFEEAPAHPLSILGMGELHLDAGEVRAARDRAEEYLRDGASGPATPRAAGLELLARAAAAEGDLVTARAALAELTAVAERLGTVPSRASVAWAAGFVAEAAADLGEARVAFEDAARLFHRVGAPWDEARALIALARVLDRDGRPADADHHQARADALLGGLHGRASEPAGSEPSGARSPLTSREREVLGLIARGLTNRDVARALVVSEHTVNRHMTNILGKLEVGSRSAAVALALRDGLIDNV
ncbi:LuxR family transcriptional regulator [Jiangella asiatica]|uniref:LuxR family transcriptional regulator n=1 Tax=Jiangella asiatica TaxID=2530372 RepID=A0A4R5CW90_9ACTN|nr:LuxR family transcriptional regulator [Jiangella asiatica]TDE02794.1 LuxR family transcriptional regulator [Jiangella asiatica]